LKLGLLFAFSLLAGCAYGTTDHQQDPTYGSFKPGQSGSDAGDNWGGDNPNNGLPTGCFYEDVVENGKLVLSFEVCNSNPEMPYKWLVDPPPDPVER